MLYESYGEFRLVKSVTCQLKYRTTYYNFLFPLTC